MKEPLEGRIDRKSQSNRTARIHGRAALRDYWKSTFEVGLTVNVEILSETAIRIYP